MAGYGSTGAGVHHGRPDEEQPLLNGERRQATKSSWKQRMNVNVKRDKADVVLLLCYIITGLLDSASISTWGSFVSMQTGNTVYIGLGLSQLLSPPSSGTPSNRWLKSLTSLASFCIGSFLFSRFHRLLGPPRRLTLIASFLFQSILILLAATILTFGPTEKPGGEDISWAVLVPIGLVAFQSCGQAVTSRALKFNALTSVVLTSIYCDLFSDAELFVAPSKNVERNRRVAAPVLLLVGAVAGGVLAKSEIGTAGVLWIAAGLKVVVVVAWGLWPGEEGGEGEE